MSLQPGPSRKISRHVPVPEEEWESRKDFIRDRFLNHRVSKRDLVAELAKEGLNASIPQLETRLALWRFRKSLPGKVWRHMDEKSQKRAAGRSRLVLLSGRPFSEEAVTAKINRHEKKEFGIRVPGKRHDNSVDLVVVSPRLLPQTDRLGQPLGSWTSNLPWLRAAKEDIPQLLRNVHFVSKAISRLEYTDQGQDADLGGVLLSFARGEKPAFSHHDTARLSAVVFTHLARASLEVSLRVDIACNTIAKELFARQRLDHIAERFDAIIPEAYHHENLMRATALSHGSPIERQREALRMILYLIANHHIPRIDRSVYTEDNLAIVSLCRLSGLDQPQRIQFLVTESQRNPLLSALVEALFEAAVSTAAADIVQGLLKATNSQFSPDAIFRYPTGSGILGLDRGNSMSSLGFAVRNGSTDMLEVLLRAGANPWADHVPDQSELLPPDSLMALAILSLPCSTCELITHSLFRLGVGVAPPHPTRDARPRLSALQAAIRRGYTDIIDQLLDWNADIGRTTRPGDLMSEMLSSWPESFGPREPDQLTCELTCLALASSFSTRYYWWASAEDRGSSVVFENDQQRALALCHQIAAQYQSQEGLGLPSTTIRNAIFAAAAQGYCDVISYLWGLRSSDFSLDASSPDEWAPLLGSIICDNSDACRLLLDLGASIANNVFEHTTFLSIAVCLGCRETVEILLDRGASLDAPFKISHTYLLPADWRISPRLNDSQADSILVTPFRAAFMNEDWNMARILACRGATVKATDLVRAAEVGQYLLVEELVTGVRNLESDDARQRVLLRAQRKALGEGHIDVAILLCHHGAVPEPGSYSSMFRCSDANVLRDLISFGLREHPSVGLEPDRDGRTYLENAIISLDQHTIDFALDLDASEYSSGALCAAVWAACSRPSAASVTLIEKLLQRRQVSSRRHASIDPAQENAALAIAILHRQVDIITRLLDEFQHCGADVAISTDHICKLRLRPGLFTNSNKTIVWSSHADGQRYWKYSLINLAVNVQDDQTLRQLLRVGYKPDSLAIVAAIQLKRPLSLIKELIENCGDIDGRQVARMERQERIDMNRLLPETGYVRTPLRMAVSQNRLDLVECLLHGGAKINSGLQLGYPFTSMPLSVAVMQNNLGMVTFLLSKGADPNYPRWSAKYHCEDSALQIAAQQGSIGIVRLLLAHGADALEPAPFESLPTRITPRNCLHRLRSSALTVAVQKQRLDTVSLLLHSDTDWAGRGCYQYSRARKTALERRYQSILQLFADWENASPNQTWTVTDLCGLADYPPGELIEAIFLKRADMHRPSYARCQTWFTGIIELVAGQVARVSSLTGHSSSDLFVQAGAMARRCIESLDPGQPWCCIPGATTWVSWSTAESMESESDASSSELSDDDDHTPYDDVIEPLEDVPAAAQRRIDAVADMLESWAAEAISDWQETHLRDGSGDREIYDLTTDQEPCLDHMDGVSPPPAHDQRGLARECTLDNQSRLPPVPEDLEMLPESVAEAPSVRHGDEMLEQQTEDATSFMRDFESEYPDVADGQAWDMGTYALEGNIITPNADAERWFRKRKAPASPVPSENETSDVVYWA